MLGESDPGGGKGRCVDPGLELPRGGVRIAVGRGNVPIQHEFSEHVMNMKSTRNQRFEEGENRKSLLIGAKIQ
jgi:hypothetical protein